MNEFPQHLCKMCGKCCKSITTDYTYDKLQKMAKKGSEEAKVFIEVFKPYASIDEAKKAVPEQIEQILKELSQSKDFDINNITFYYCPHVTDEDKCGIYEQRPECCRRTPMGPWACMPPGCGFEGWQFEESEKIKKKVRKLKEYLLTVEAVSENGLVPGSEMKIEELRELIKEKIEPWKKYGSLLW